MKNMMTKMKAIQVALIVVGLLMSAAAYSQGWQQVWADEFDGPSLNSGNWTVEVNDFGGYNNELQYYTNRPENVRIENNVLVIEARKENYLTRNYTSARLITEGKKSWKYGKVEAKMKLPYGTGMWPAFWMMGNQGEWPACGEIDIMEMVGGNKCGECGDNKTHGYMWYADNGDKTSGTEAPALASGKYADDYHLFAIEWDASSIKWFIDGNEFHSESITASARSEFHQPFYILLNLAVGGDWPGSPDETTVFPQKLYVDYVRVYQRSTCTVPAQPAAIVGNTTVNPGTSQTYSIPAVSGATTYSWTLPSGWTGTSTTNSITTVAGSAGGTISVKANNACGASTARTVAVTVSGTGNGFTARIEAENYAYMAGVTKQTCSEGGINISSFDASDWMSYSVNIPTAGTYKVSYRVASATAGKTLRLEKNDGATLLGTVTAPNTGSLQTWTTVSHNVTLTAGVNELGLTTYTGGLNINWFEITNNLTAVRSATETPEGTVSIDIYPNPVESTLTIKTSPGFKDGQFKIMDRSGKEVLTGKTESDTLDVATLPAGVYILRLTKGKRSVSRKFIKK